MHARKCILLLIGLFTLLKTMSIQVRKQWDASITGGSCIDGVPMYTAMASITMVFDVVV